MNNYEYNPRTHRVTDDQLPVVKELPCNCGAERGVSHTVHEHNPTGHAVGCPVFLRWQAVHDKA